MPCVFRSNTVYPWPWRTSVGGPGWHGEGRRAPDLARLLIAEIDDFAGTVRHRIVVPGRQAIGLAVPRPGESGAGFGDEESELGVGNDVDPRCRRQVRMGVGPAAGLAVQEVGVRALGLDEEAVFAAVGGKTAKAIEVPQVGGQADRFVVPVALGSRSEPGPREATGPTRFDRAGPTGGPARRRGRRGPPPRAGEPRPRTGLLSRA